MLSFVFGLTTVFDFAVHYLLLEGSILAKQHIVLSMLLWGYLFSVHVCIIAPFGNPVNWRVFVLFYSNTPHSSKKIP